MAYPFAPAPTFAELKSTLIDKYNCTYERLCQIENSKGLPVNLICFRRTVDGRPLSRVCVELADTTRLTPHNLRSILDHLKIPYEKDNLFGLHLG